MSFWKNVVARPGLWIACGVAIGVVSTAAVVNGLGSSTAIAQSGLPAMRPVASISEQSMAQLRDLDQSFANLAEFINPSVVHIRAMRPATNASGMMMGPTGSQGSGVIYREDGWIITNDHVVNGAQKVTVVLADGRELEGTVRRGKDLFNDIALVKVDAKELVPARFADSGRVRPGQHAIAVGAPFGLENTVTIGHISGLGRANNVMSTEGERAYTNMIQTDAPINPGNSGGPLLNIEGEVVGINTSIIGTMSLMGQGGSVGIGFAIPSNQARTVADLLIEKGKITRAYMGLAPDDLKPFEKKKFNRDAGSIVRQVPNDGPAATAGIKAEDIIVRIQDLAIRDSQDLRNAMLRYAPGTTVKVDYVRNGATKSVTVKLDEFPNQLRAQRGPIIRDLEPRQAPEDLDSMQKDLRERMRDFGLDLDRENRFFVPNEGDPKDDVPAVREGQARLGVTVEALSAERRTEFDVPESEAGVLVTAVEPGSVAEKLGLKTGDVISKVGDKKIERPQDLVDAMRGVKWGDSRSITIARFGEGSQMRRTQDVRFK